MRSVTPDNLLLLVTALPVLVGAILWLGSVQTQGASNVKSLEAVVLKQDKYTEVLIQIDKRLTRIEGKLGVNE